MRLIEKLSQSRYDFTAVLMCEHCSSTQFMDNGYDDDIFLYKVIPAIKCIKCEKRAVETIPDGIGDPGYQGGFIVERKPVTEYRWDRP